MSFEDKKPVVDKNLVSVLDVIANKPDSDGKTYEYQVPSYQRCYRWTKVNVEDLLDDLVTFYDGHNGDQQKYCLQPIILKDKEDKDKEGNSNLVKIVIDGQQRLTTLYILMAYIKKWQYSKSERYQAS